MAYEIVIYPEVEGEIHALPPTARSAFAEAMAVVELVPWNGDPQHENNPDGAVRRLVFSHSGIVVYLILEDQHRVDVVQVTWIG